MKVKSEREVTQLCPTFHNPMDCSLLDSSVPRILQARILEWFRKGPIDLEKDKPDQGTIQK